MCIHQEPQTILFADHIIRVKGVVRVTPCDHRLGVFLAMVHASENTLEVLLDAIQIALGL